MSLIKADPNKQGWEAAEFPILCETCLGENPYVRMTKQNYGKECKICGRPFTVFRWLPGLGMRYKKTEICQSCAKMKNVCQTCVLDLQYGLPTQVRDAALNITSNAPQSDINRQYFAQNMDQQIENGASLIDYDKASTQGKEVLKRIARNEPYYKRNRAHICSFFVKGECKRGDECPYRHELPEDNDLTHQNIRDRYYGTNDPVAKKMLNRVRGGNTALTPPEDKTVTSMFVTGIEEDITEQDLRDFFYAFGEIKSVVVVYKSRCAFINYATRVGAENAAERTSETGCIIKGHALRVAWGRPRPQGPRSEPKAPTAASGSKAVKEISLADLKIPAPPSSTGKQAKYPSQDPTYQGSRA
ncbi:Pre-mRNA-splicing factor slt11 [Umbelopsis nana]